METISIIIQSLNLVVVIITAIAIWRTLRSSNDWNRRKTTHEILDKLVVGDIPLICTKIKVDFKCQVDDENLIYSNFIKTLPESDKLTFSDLLVRLLNIFEVIAVDIKNNIVDEDISYDYLCWFYTSFYRFGESYIKQKRHECGDPRVLINFSKQAEKWKEKMKSDMKKLEIGGKGKL